MKWKAKICGAVTLHSLKDMDEKSYVGTNFLNLLRAFDIKEAKQAHMSYGKDVWQGYSVCKWCGKVYPYATTVS